MNNVKPRQKKISTTSKVMGVVLVIMWLAIYVMHFHRKLVDDCIWEMKGFNTPYCSFSDEKKELADGFISDKRGHPYLYVQRDGPKVGKDLIFFYYRARSSGNLDLLKHFTDGKIKCGRVNSNKKSRGKDVFCANEEAMVVMALFGEFTSACRNVYSQANLLSIKYLGQPFPDCLDIERFEIEASEPKEKNEIHLPEEKLSC